MKLNELLGKEIINLATGEKFGIIAEAELTFNQQTGKLESILLPGQEGIFNFFSEEQFFEIPWKSIVKVGKEVVIIDLNIEKYN